MSIKSNKLLKTIQVNEKAEEKQERMGIITELYPGAATSKFYLKFCGEEEPSNLVYERWNNGVSGIYVGDRVLLEKKCGKYYVTRKVN